MGYGAAGYGAGSVPIGAFSAVPTAPVGTPGVGGYGGGPYGGFTNYASPLLSGAYSATGYPTFGYFPYSALAGNTTNPSPYGYYNPYAMFLGCTNTYTASNFYVCR